MIYSNDLFEMLSSMIGHNRQAKVTHFSSKNLPTEQMGNLDQIAPNLYNFISYDPLKGYLWNVKCYNGVQLVNKCYI